MNDDVLLTLLSSAPSLPGLILLHCAFRTNSIDRREMGSWKGIALILAGLLLVALPLVVWGGSTLHQDQKGARLVSPAAVFLLAGGLSGMLLWFIWMVSSFVFAESGFCENVWVANWGASYSPELKRRLLGTLLDQLDNEGKIGNLILDIGSGAAPVSKHLPSIPGRRFVLLDIAGENSRTSESQFVRFDVENIMRPESVAYRKALVRVCRFIGRDLRSPGRDGRATAMVFSDILNYVDFRKVIGGFAEFLLPDGRIIIVNSPGRGIREQFSENGLKKNEDLYEFLEEQNFEIEYKNFPCRPRKATDESEEMMVLVARKEVSFDGFLDFV